MTVTCAQHGSAELVGEDTLCTYFIVKTHKVFCEFSQFTKKY